MKYQTKREEQPHLMVILTIPFQSHFQLIEKEAQNQQRPTKTLELCKALLNSKGPYFVKLYQ